MAKIGRNEPCPCGSGLKYKKCHASPGGPPVGKAASAVPNLQHVLEQMRASERIRQTQQGLGRPIIAFNPATARSSPSETRSISPTNGRRSPISSLNI